MIQNIFINFVYNVKKKKERKESIKFLSYSISITEKSTINVEEINDNADIGQNNLNILNIRFLFEVKVRVSI